MGSRSKSINFITLIFIILQILISYGLFKNNEKNFIYEVLVTTAVILIYTFFEIKYNLFLSHYIRILVITTILLHTFVGDYLNLYAKSFVFDKILHGYGTYAFTLFVYVIINQLIKNIKHRMSYDFIFIVCLGMALGQGLEFIEFLIDLLFKPAEPAQGGLLDTNLDMILNTVGAAFAAIHLTLSNFSLLKKHK